MKLKKALKMMKEGLYVKQARINCNVIYCFRIDITYIQAPRYTSFISDTVTKSVIVHMILIILVLDLLLHILMSQVVITQYPCTTEQFLCFSFITKVA